MQTLTPAQDKQLTRLMGQLDTSIREVEAENPDAECGWEHDVLRSMVDCWTDENDENYPDAVKREALRIWGVA